MSDAANQDRFIDAFYNKLIETHLRLRDQPDYREMIDIGVRMLIALEKRTKREPLQILVGIAECQMLDRASGREPRVPDAQLEWLCAAYAEIIAGEMEGFDAIDQHGNKHTVAYDPGNGGCLIGKAYWANPATESLVELVRRQQHVWATPDGTLVLTAEGLG